MTRAGESGKAAAGPAWWSKEVRLGQSVELMVYGGQMSGLISGFRDGLIEVGIAARHQVLPMRVSTVSGTAVISVDGGAASTPVYCWPEGDVVRLEVVGPVELVQRRRHTRRPLDVPVVLTWAGVHAGSWEQALSRTADISAGGLRVSPAGGVTWPSPGSAVNVALDLPGDPITMAAFVLGWTPNLGLRLRFADLPSDLGLRIARFVAESRAHL